MTNFNLATDVKGKVLNSLGRSTGRQFNMAAIKREILAKQSKGFDAAKFEANRQKRDAQPNAINFGGR